MSGGTDTARAEGKTVLITGANRGIGKAVADKIARTGARVVLGCREAARGEAARDELRKTTGNSAIECMTVDLADQRSIRSFVKEFRERYDALHVLVNNAGVLLQERRVTKDGVEETFAVNHVAYFLLTNLLLKQLEASAPARIVNVASAAHQRVSDFTDPQSESSYDPLMAYSKSKLANLYFTYQLAQRLGGTGVTVNAVHPGVVDTGLLSSLFKTRLWLRMLFWVKRVKVISTDDGADTIAYLATSPDVEGVSGKYFVNRHETESSPLSYDEILANQLWERSLELTAGSR